MNQGPSGSPPAGPLFDANKMRENLGSWETVEHTLVSFLSRASKTQTSLQEAAKNKDYVRLRRDAHSLKGACGYLASERLLGSAFRLQLAAEAAMRGEEPDVAVETCLESVQSDMALVCAAAEAALASGRSGARLPVPPPQQPAQAEKPAEDFAAASKTSPAPVKNLQQADSSKDVPAKSLLDLDRMRVDRVFQPKNSLATAPPFPLRH